MEHLYFELTAISPLAIRSDHAPGGAETAKFISGTALLGSLASDSTVLAQDRLAEQPVFGLYRPVHTTDPTMWSFASSDKQDLDEPLTIETHVGDEGRVIDYEVLSGPQSPEVNGWIHEMLSLAQFTPATAFGKPVESEIILSFVAVRN